MGRGHSRQRRCHRSMTAEEPDLEGMGVGAQDDVLEQRTGARPSRDRLHRLREQPGRHAGERKIECNSAAPEDERHDDHDRHHGDHPHLHDQPDGGKDGVGKPIDEPEHVLLDGAHRPAGHPDHHQHHESRQAPRHQIPGMPDQRIPRDAERRPGRDRGLRARSLPWRDGRVTRLPPHPRRDPQGQVEQESEGAEHEDPCGGGRDLGPS